MREQHDVYMVVVVVVLVCEGVLDVWLALLHFSRSIVVVMQGLQSSGGKGKWKCCVLDGIFVFVCGFDSTRGTPRMQ